MNKLFTYLEKYGLLSLEKQDKLMLLVGEHMHEIDLENGKIRFDDVEFPFQALGTESDNTLTWLWAWADEQAEVSEDLLDAARQMRDWGKREGLREFVVPGVDLDKADGLAFSLIAGEVCKASCFYRDAYEGGSLFVLLFDNDIDRQPPFDIARLSRQYAYLISRYDLDHRNALLSYLNAKGLSPLSHGSQITGKLETGELLSAEFDKAGRLMSLNGEAVDGESIVTRT
jgi:hypothetical protein